MRINELSNEAVFWEVATWVKGRKVAAKSKEF